MKITVSYLFAGIFYLSVHCSMIAGTLCPASRRVATTASKSWQRLGVPASRAYSSRAGSEIQDQSKALVPVSLAVGPWKEPYPHLGFRSKSEREAKKIYEQRAEESRLDTDLVGLPSWEQEARTQRKALALEALRTDKYPEIRRVREKMEGTASIPAEVRLAKAEQAAERLTEIADRHPENNDLAKKAASARKEALKWLDSVYPREWTERILARREGYKPTIVIKQQQSPWYERAVAEEEREYTERDKRIKASAEEAERRRPLHWYEQQTAKEAAEKQKREALAKQKKAQEEAVKKEQELKGWRGWLKKLW